MFYNGTDFFNKFPKFWLYFVKNQLEIFNNIIKQLKHQKLLVFKVSYKLKFKKKPCNKKTLKFIPTDLRKGLNKLNDESSNDEQDLILKLCN